MVETLEQSQPKRGRPRGEKYPVKRLVRLDPETDAQLAALAANWEVSGAQVVRILIADAAAASAAPLVYLCIRHECRQRAEVRAAEPPPVVTCPSCGEETAYQPGARVHPRHLPTLHRTHFLEMSGREPDQVPVPPDVSDEWIEARARAFQAEYPDTTDAEAIAAAGCQFQWLLRFIRGMA